MLLRKKQKYLIRMIVLVKLANLTLRCNLQKVWVYCELCLIKPVNLRNVHAVQILKRVKDKLVGKVNADVALSVEEQVNMILITTNIG